jgi:hypothetical protein
MSSSIEMRNEVTVNSLLMKSLESATREYARKCVRQLALEYGFSESEALKKLNLENLKLQVQEMKKRSGGKAKTEKPEKREKREKTKKVEKALFPLPFSVSNVLESGCQGLAYNGGLFTQCPKSCMESLNYCKTCQSEIDKNGATTNGTVAERLACDLMEFKDPKGRKPVAYVKIMEKQKVSREQVEAEASKLNIMIDETHFVAVEKKEKKEKKKVEKEDKEDDLLVQLMDELVDEDEELEEALKQADEKAAKQHEENAEKEKALKAQQIADEKAAKALKAQQIADEKAAKALKQEEEKAAKAQQKQQQEAEKAAKAQQIAEEKAEKENKIAEEKAAKAQQIAEEKALKKQQQEEEKALKKQQQEEEKAAKKQQEKEEGIKKLKEHQKKATTPEKKQKEGTKSIVATKANFKEGDKVEYRDAKGEVSKGSVIKVKMGKSFVEYDLKMEDGSTMTNAPEGNVMAAKEEAAVPAKKVTVKRITIEGKQYLKTADNLLYDPETKEEMGIYDPVTNTIKDLPDDSEDELCEDDMSDDE